MNAEQKVIARFWPKVEVRGEEDCWEWRGTRNEKGYGRLHRGGNSQHRVYAHRVSYEIAMGAIPDGMTIDHVCVNTGCVNPKHLQLVTLSENSGLAKRRWTHCPRGHEFTPENTYIRPEGRRMCRACIRARRKR